MQVKSEGYNAEWFRDYANVTKLGRHLASNATILDAGEMVKYFEKPWKWSGEWDEMVRSEIAKTIQCSSCKSVFKDHEFFTGISLRCPKCNSLLKE